MNMIQQARQWARTKRMLACDALGTPAASELFHDARRFDDLADWIDAHALKARHVVRNNWINSMTTQNTTPADEREAERIVRAVCNSDPFDAEGNYRLTPAEMSAALQSARSGQAEPMTRFCPGCGSVGEVEAKYRDCCPDGSGARLIPESLAHKCRDLFQLAISAASGQAGGDAGGEAMLAAVKSITDAALFWADQRVVGTAAGRTAWIKLVDTIKATITTPQPTAVPATQADVAGLTDEFHPLPRPVRLFENEDHIVLGFNEEQMRSYAATVPPHGWELVLPGGLHTDKWDSARVGDYNAGWNDYRRKARAALTALATKGAAVSAEGVRAALRRLLSANEGQDNIALAMHEARMALATPAATVQHSDGRGTDAQIEKERDIARHAIVGALAAGYAGAAHPGADHWLAAAHDAGVKIKALEQAATVQGADDHRAAAQADAYVAGVGFLVDGERVSPGRVQLITTASQGAAHGASEIADLICREVAELPDRTSPEGWPDAMLVTADELHAIVIAALAANKEQQG